MKRAMLVCVAALVSTLVLAPSPGGAASDSSKVIDVPFGTLVRGAACPAATHTLLSPCYPYPPGAFVVFQSNRDVTRFEGRNVTMHGTLDETSCALPLFRATKIALSDSLPPCPQS